MSPVIIAAVQTYMTITTSEKRNAGIVLPGQDVLLLQHDWHAVLCIIISIAAVVIRLLKAREAGSSF